MDTLTHGLLGALTMHGLPRRSENISLKEITILGFIAAVFPDVDYLMFWIHPLQFLAEWHRAATHSLVMLPIWSLLIGFTAAIVIKARWKWRMYTLVCGIAILTHILSDIITLYGTQIFNPISDYKAVIGTTFYIDGYFTGIVLFGLLGSLLVTRYKPRYHGRFAVAAFCLLVSYLGLQSWFRFLASEYADRYLAQNNLQAMAVYKHPQPFSPTYWKLIIESNDSYHVTFINVLPADWHQKFTHFMVKVLSGNSKMIIESARQYLPTSNAVWSSFQKIDGQDEVVFTAWNQDEFSAFRKFAILPILYRKDHDTDGICVWFTDLRYVFPVMLPPFRYGMCNNHNRWSPFRLERNTINSRKPLQWPYL